MSISVKSIAVSIDGKQSEQFNIELNGSKFVMEEFSLTQHLLEPCFLSFNLHKDAEEDINDIEFNVPASIIGKEVTLLLQTECMEQSMEGFEEGSQNGDIEFKGFITNASAMRADDNDYNIQVEAVTHDGKMYTNSDCFMYNKYTLAAIVSELVGTDYKLDVEGTVAYQDEIHYTVQYNEGDYQFLQRLASRYGEWMYNTGTKLHFGKLENQESIQLTYPSQDVTNYSVRLQTYHQQNVNMHLLYNRGGAMSAGFGSEQKEVGHKLNDSVFKASKKIYPRLTIHVEQGTTMEKDEGTKNFKSQQEKFPIPMLGETSMAQFNSLRSNMVVYSGTSYCSRLRIGTKLTINDGYISGENGQKSEVKQDEILITCVTHSFNVNQKYENTFEGIPAVFNCPPYYNPTLYPRCYNPVRATVIDTEDPMHWGRVRVRFDWQIREYHNGQHGDNRNGNKEKNGVSPWIHVLQSYIGGNVDAGGLYGSFIIPEIFSNVFVGFEEGNMERPYVLGAHFNHDCPVDPQWYPGDNNVKAFRSASGHTIEIHDTQSPTHTGEKGYVRVYDTKHHTYELLLSTDRLLIKLKSAGNIELEAGKDIKLTAGNDIRMKAKNDMDIRVNNNMDTSVTNDWSLMVGKSANTHAGTELIQSSEDNMTIATEKELTVTSEEDMTITSKKKQYVNVKEDQIVNIDKDCKIAANNFGVQAQQAVKIKGMNSSYLSDQQAKMQGAQVEVNASATAKIAASASLDLNAPIIKES